jgi:hypothetical protein
MKTTTFVKATVFAAGLTMGAFNLSAAPPKPTQSLPGTNTAVSHDLPAPQNWMEEHLKGKTGRYSGAEETRLQEARSSTAYRAETAAPASGLTDLEQRRKIKQGQ